MGVSVQQINPSILSVHSVQSLPEEINSPELPLESYCLLYTATGSFEVTWDQKSIVVPPNCAFLFLPEFCYMTQPLVQKLQLIDIRFHLSSDEKKQSKEPKIFASPLLFEPSPPNKRNLEGILWENKKQQTFSGEISELYLKAILLGIVRDTADVEKNNVSDAAIKIMRYVHAHITENIQNDTIARELSYHPNYINRVIKKATGMTFHKYVVDEKLHYATSLLLSTNDSITDIAYSLSFNTSSHFSNLFAEKYHCTPSQYRKRNV